MNIIISTASNKPIYEQITAQIKRMIISGELRCGTALPSMRLLAKELRISVITTKRAYTDLERDGFITTAVGKGSFVAEKNHDDRCRQQQTLARDQFCAAVETAKDAGITREELQETLDLTYTKE